MSEPPTSIVPSSTDVKIVELFDKSQQVELGQVNFDGFAPVAPTNAPTVLTFSNLKVTTRQANVDARKVLLNNISGSITGGLWAIMGSSGSGKTTFLSSMARRLDTNRMAMSGDILLNGRQYSKHELKSMSGYVMQDDLIHAHLTVKETLMFTAQLRLPREHYKDAAQIVEETMKTMGITHCKDVIVGDSRNKGISGGERKRLCIGMELLTKPKLLFLDEPTSGLDSTVALTVMTILKNLAHRGDCTVICTIHQPQTKIFQLCDNLILMRHGDILYQGEVMKSIDFFAQRGFPCPPLTNPADHLLDVVSGGDGEEEVEHIPFVVPIDPDYGSDKPAFTLKSNHPWLTQFQILFRRNTTILQQQ